jgi:hypothetical protein
MTNPASVWTKDYISESGWICKVNTSHVDNPKTGENYGVESSSIIDSTGFDHLDVATVQNEANQNIQSKCRVSIPPP